MNSLSAQRLSGILLHVSSLPSHFGIGDMGPSAFRFVDWLKGAGQTLWQVLPLGVTDQYGCPYASFSAFGGDPLLLSPELLVDYGLLDKEALSLFKISPKPGSRIEQGFVHFSKYALLRQAYLRSKEISFEKNEFEAFIQATKSWSEDMALFMALTYQHGAKWWLWPNSLSTYASQEVKDYKVAYADEIRFHLFLQYLFDKQWKSLKSYCHKQGIQVIGDIPIFVSLHSMDVWKRPEHFKLNSKFELEYEAGAAPDQFSDYGQKWGTPLYYWEKMEKENFSWWLERMRYMFETFDLVRLDHFRGFCAVWEIPHQDPDARLGRWYKGPGAKLFDALLAEFKELPIIIEDLGEITPDVIELKKRYDFSGMKILQFAFVSDETNDNLPAFITPKDIVYTGTHDMETVNGRFWGLPKTSAERRFVNRFLGLNNKMVKPKYHWDFIKMAFDSQACVAIAPLQDVLGLGNEARTNVPGVQEGNWNWRFSFSQLDEHCSQKLRQLSVNSKRNKL